MKQLLTTCSIAATLVAPCAMASSLDVDLNNDALKAQFNASDAKADLGLSGAILLTDDHGEAYSVTLRTQGVLADQEHIRGGFGGRAYHIAPAPFDGSFQSLAVGGYLDVTIPEFTDLTLSVELYYAPSITTTDDVDNVSDFGLRASYQLFQNASAYIGLRYLEAEIENFDIEIDDGAHIGFTLQF